MKKLLAITLALLLLLGLAACTPKGEYADERAFVEGYLELVREKGIGTEAFAEYETYHAPGTLTEEDREANALLLWNSKSSPRRSTTSWSRRPTMVCCVTSSISTCSRKSTTTARSGSATTSAPYSPEIEEKMSNHPAADDPDFAERGRSRSRERGRRPLRRRGEPGPPGPRVRRGRGGRRPEVHLHRTSPSTSSISWDTIPTRSTTRRSSQARSRTRPRRSSS